MAKRREAQEEFGEATLGEAQADNPPSDPEMLEQPPAPDENEEPAGGPQPRSDEGEDERSPEETAGDQDAGPAYTDERAELDEQRDQAEG